MNCEFYAEICVVEGAESSEASRFRRGSRVKQDILIKQLTQYPDGVGPALSRPVSVRQRPNQGPYPRCERKHLAGPQKVRVVAPRPPLDQTPAQPIVLVGDAAARGFEALTQSMKAFLRVARRNGAHERLGIR